MNQTVLNERCAFVLHKFVKSCVDIEKLLRNEIQKLGLASVGDITNQSFDTLINDKDLENLNTNDFFEDHFNLSLTNLSQKVLPINDMTSSNILTQNNNLINCTDQQFSFKLSNDNKENFNEDVVLKFTQHFENKIKGLLKCLKEAIEAVKNQDLKVLRERNIELSNRLKDEENYKDIAVRNLNEAQRKCNEYLEINRKYENDYQDYNELKNQNEKLKNQIKQHENEFLKLIKDKGELNKYNLLFKNNLPELEKQLKIDLENSKQQIEFIEKERHDAIQKLNQLKAEKDDLIGQNQNFAKEIELRKVNFENEIKALKKKLNDQKEQMNKLAQERDSEYQENIDKIENLEEQLAKKERNESNCLKKIREYDEQIEMINKEKQNLEKKFNDISLKLRAENEKNVQLNHLLEDYNKTKANMQQIEKELLERITNLEKDLIDQLKLNETLKKNQTEQSTAIETSFLNHVYQSVGEKEQLRDSSNHDPISFDLHSNRQIQETLDNTTKQLIDNSLNISSSNDRTFLDAQRLVERNKKLDSEVNKIILLNKGLNDELENVKKLNDGLESKNKNLEANIDDFRKRLVEMENEKKVLETNIRKKEKCLIELEQQLEQKLDNNNEDELKQSIESLKKKLNEKKQQANYLNEILNEKDLKLTSKENQIHQKWKEIEKMKQEKEKIEDDKLNLESHNQRLLDEKARLEQELQKELEADLDIKEMFEIVLQEKDEEIAYLNSHLDEINRKLLNCSSSSSTVNDGEVNCFTLLDELISFYRKNNPIKEYNKNLNFQKSESLDSFSPIESCEDQLTSDELNGNDFDDDICNKLAGIHNNSIEICNLSFHFKNEKDLVKLINEIPDIITNYKLSKEEINDWQSNFVDCFSNKTIAQLLTKNIISVRPNYINCIQLNGVEKHELNKQIEMYKSKLKDEISQNLKIKIDRKSLILQKQYLINSIRKLEQNTSIKLLSTHRNSNHLNNRKIILGSGWKKAKKCFLAIIALIRMKNSREQREHYDQNDLAKKIDVACKIDYFLNQITNQLTNVLQPTTEKYSSFIDSLQPSKPIIQSNHQISKNLFTNQNQLKDNSSNKIHQQTFLLNKFDGANKTIKDLKDLLDSLLDVYKRIQSDDLTSSNFSWLSD